MISLKEQFGEVFTPISLVNKMLDKLPKEIWHNKNLKWIDPSCGISNFLVVIKERLMQHLEIPNKEKYILENMIYGVDIQEKNIISSKSKLDPNNKYKLNIETQDALNFDFWNLQFDVVVGNPPYQDNSESKGRFHKLWDKFVFLAFDKLLAKNGYLCYIHPSKWRNIDDHIGKKIKNYQMEFLSIHDEKDGLKTFNAGTRYDWYISKNSFYSCPTMIDDQNRIMNVIDFRDWDFIPNCNFDKIRKLTTGNDKCNVIRNTTSYSACTTKIKDDEHLYPCAYSVNRNNDITIKWASKKKDEHYVPKVIWGSGSTGFYIDSEGEYGLTEWCAGLADIEENLPQIAIALNTNEFKEIIRSIAVGSQEINPKILSCFKKDFWKEYR